MTPRAGILVVDDDAEILAATARLLERAGYAVDTAATGETALQAARRRPPELVLLDRDLPGLGGIEWCRRIKQDPALVDALVVMTSASFTASDEQADGLEAGADGCIARPIGDRELLVRVSAFVRIQRLTRALRLQADAGRADAVGRDRVDTYRGMSGEVLTRRQAEEQLQQLDARIRQSEKTEAIRQLASGIAHDFNNALGGVIGFTGMSLRHAEQGSILERNLINVLKAADRAKRLVQQILTFSRQDHPQKSLTALRPIVSDVLALLKASVPASVVIEADLHDPKPVLGDPAQLHELLLHLATNAVHAMAGKGRLTIRLGTVSLGAAVYGRAGELMPGEYVVLEVTDTGCGMDAATVSRAFEPFFTTRAVGEGTGMGLSVALGMVQSHGGDIQVDSVPGQGSSFRVFLPLADEPVAEVVSESNLAPISGHDRILFVDDERMMVEMAQHMLTTLGYRVTCVGDSLEALRLLQERSADFDVLITDQTMPAMTGAELAKAANAIRADLPVILCTGHSIETDRAKAAAAGVSRIVMKPYRMDEIGSVIRDVVGGNRKGTPHGEHPGRR